MMTARFVALASGALRLAPLRLYARLVPRELHAFCYHVVSDEMPSHMRHLYPVKTRAQFASDLEYLGRNYDLVSYDDLRREPARQRSGRMRALVTFDDGYAECHDVVRPLLLSYGIPAVFFLTTDFLDNRRLFYRNKVSLSLDTYHALGAAAAAYKRREIGELLGSPISSTAQLEARLHDLTLLEEPTLDAICELLGIDVATYLSQQKPYLTEAQVKQLAGDGFTIGAHTTAHSRLGALAEPDAMREIVDSCLAIDKLVNTGDVPFAFPFNGDGVRRAALRQLLESHPFIGLLFDTRLLARDAPFLLNRIVADRPSGRRQSSNLPEYLRKAYAIELLRGMTRRIGFASNGARA